MSLHLEPIGAIPEETVSDHLRAATPQEAMEWIVAASLSKREDKNEESEN